MAESESQRPNEQPLIQTVEIDPDLHRCLEKATLELHEGVYSRSLQKRGDFL
ncbi:MAG: hypothetical protein RIQ56_622 [Candidatus Parcubacteria bacterium]